MNNEIKKSMNESILKQIETYQTGGIIDLSILNLAGGKFKPLLCEENLIDKLRSKTLIHLDRMYMNSISINDLINSIKSSNGRNYVEYYVNYEIFDFLTNYQFKFDLITIYRFLEHVKKNDVLYFIYLLSTTVEVGGVLDIIVPDYEKLAKRILQEDPFDKDFERDDIITTFELLNEPYDPHASIWTDKRIYRFFELEERFKIMDLRKDYLFDGRDIYIRFLARRVK